MQLNKEKNLKKFNLNFNKQKLNNNYHKIPKFQVKTMKVA